MKHLLPVGARRAAAGAGVLAFTAAACTACVGASTTSADSSAPTTPGTTASAAPTTAAGGVTTATSAAPTGGSHTTAGTGGGSGSNSSPATCQPSHLSGSIGSSQGSAGSVYIEIVFKNTGSQPCTLEGYPGVSLAAGDPVSQVGQPAARNPQATPLKVTLLPNGHANAVLQIGDFDNWPASTCDPVSTTYLLVYPPNDTSQVKIPYTTTGCRGNVVTLHIEAVQPGAGQPAA